MHYFAEVWTWIKATDPAWIGAGASLVGAVFAMVVWSRRARQDLRVRQELRGSGAAIIALLGESCHEALAGAQSRGRVGWIEHSGELVYFMVGTDHYLLCKRDLERLHAQGYVYRERYQYHLSRLGRLLLERHDNARLLARGVARAKRQSYLRCNGGLWLRCRCEKSWVAGHEKIHVPFPLRKWLTTTRLGQWLTTRTGRAGS